MSHAPDSPAPDRDAADQLAELTRVTGGLAHEIRNPLSTLRVNLQLLADEWRELADGTVQRLPDAADIGRRGLKRIETLMAEIDRLTHTLENYLRFVGRDELQVDETNLNDLVAELVTFFEPQALASRVRLSLNCSAEPLRCRADSNLLRQALLNLLLNAQQALPTGGEIAVRTLARGDAACVEIADSGEGIPADRLARVFDPYFSTRPRGTGLGLPTARRIISRHGGRLEVESPPGSGATFRVVLPLVR